MSENSNKIILHLCADVGSDSIFYKKNGYDVRLIGKDIGVENFHPPQNVYGIIANPPCTHFSIARTVAKTPRDLREGMRLVKECLRIIWECQYDIEQNERHCPLKFWVIENPSTGMLKYFLGKPVYEYSPHEFGANFTKGTALWGQFTPPQKPFWIPQLPKGRSIKNVMPIQKYKGKNRREQQMTERSLCCEGFAKAFYRANQ
jgi:hypothetical protein